MSDPKLNHVFGHAVGCLCEECMRRQVYLDAVDDNVSRSLRAEDARAADRAVPTEMTARQIAEGNHADETIAAHQVAEVRRKVSATRDARLHTAETIVRETRGRRMPEASFRGFTEALRHVRELGESGRELAALELEHRQRAHDARVIAEPEPYGEGSPHSWVQDSLAASGTNGLHTDRVAAGHQERLARHGQDVARALQTRSEYGRRIERSYREQFRQQDPHLNRQTATKALQELRALSTGGGATASAAGGGAAAFVPPAILMEAWATYRSPYRAFADQLNTSVDLPAWGMEVYVPTFTTGTTVATHAEITGVAEGDPVSAFASSAVVEKAGQITVSQAFLDRAGPGISGDQILFAQLKDQLGAQIDQYAIAQTLANAQAVTNAGAFALASASGVGGFLKDLKSAKNLLHDTAGVRLRATHLFSSGDFADFIESYADAQGRPVFSPCLDDNRLPIRSQGDPDGEGYTGYVVAGLAHYADDNIPNSGSNTQIIVARPSTVLLLEGAPVCYVAPQGAAGNLEAVLGVRTYVACVARYASGVAVISGASYLASTFS